MDPLGKKIAPVLQNFAPSLIEHPNILRSLTIGLDSLFVTSNLTGAALSKAITMLGGAAAGAVGAWTGAVTGGVTSFISGLDIGHEIAKLIASAGNDINKNVISIMEFLDYIKGEPGTKINSLCSELIAKISGAGKTIIDNIKFMSAVQIQLENGKIGEKTIKSYQEMVGYLATILKAIEDINYVLDVLRHKETRDLYIAESESVAGAAGRGVDYVVNKFTTGFGLLGDKKEGENVTGFANTYNQMMDYVTLCNDEINAIYRTIKPYIDKIQAFRGMLKEANEALSEQETKKEAALSYKYNKAVQFIRRNQ